MYDAIKDDATPSRKPKTRSIQTDLRFVELMALSVFFKAMASIDFATLSSSSSFSRSSYFFKFILTSVAIASTLAMLCWSANFASSSF